ncbi:MAG: N-acetylmuramic acid 6-phosphate etherase [Oscillospiraceae bacterium]|nr:N-acetylmuramic acid 6-phosphate etherase [Oscillospiraceae bacterium]
MHKTEMRNPRTTNISNETTIGMLKLIQDENRVAVDAIEAALPSIERACDLISERIAKGGRLIYIGAGTSGRLGVMDAVECPPTYGVSSELICGIIAGGFDRMYMAAEGAEDVAENGIRDLAAKNLRAEDCVCGISAAGNAAYVAEALAYAKGLGCLTIGLTCNEDSRLATECDVSIVTDTGAEVVTGSTRMKAGSAHKMVLNMISTCVMIKAGNVYENMMINLKPTNIKLRRRVISIVREIFCCDEERACELLEKHDWSIRAVVDNEK